MFSKQKFDNYRDKFKRFLKVTPNFGEAYKYESLQIYQDHWNIGASNMAEMYESCFPPDTEDRLWTRQINSPTELMMQFAEMNPDFVQALFDNLHNDANDVTLRAGRFISHCDELLKQLQEKKPQYNFHYHDDYKMISVYLAFHYPGRYTIYDEVSFRKMMQKLDAKNIPTSRDIERFFKIAKVMYKFLAQDEELLEIHKEKISGDKYYQGPSLLLVHDFYYCCTQMKYQVERY